MSTTKTRERLKDLAMEAYLEWRVVCSAVDEAYECWARGPRDEAAAAFRRYRAALDAEERLSLEYARLDGRSLGMSRPRTAFVLSGGASLGAVHAGMLGALFERGITADLLVGTSAGALNAAFIASRPQTVETARALRRVWCDLQRDDIFPVSMRALVGGLCGKRDHLVPDDALRRLVQPAHRVRGPPRRCHAPARRRLRRDHR